MKNTMQIIDILLNVVTVSCILIMLQNAKPAKQKHIITAEDINNMRRPLLSMIMIVTHVTMT